MYFPDPNKLHCFQLTVTPGNILTCVSIKVIFKQQIPKAFEIYNIWFDLSSNFLKVMTVMTIPYEDEIHGVVQ